MEIEFWLREWWSQVPCFPQILSLSMSRGADMGWDTVSESVYETEY